MSDVRPFRDSLLSTLGTAAGLALVVGLPTLIVGSCAVYAAIAAVRDYKIWRAERASTIAGRVVEVRELPSTSKDTVVGAKPAKRSRERRSARQRSVSRDLDHLVRQQGGRN